MEKTISIFIDGVPTYSLQIRENSKIGDVKKKLEKFNIVSMAINKNLNLDVFEDAKYDQNDFSSIFEEIDNGIIYVTNKNEKKDKNEKMDKNEKKDKCGKIRIAQQAKGKSYPNYKDFENIPCWSRGKGEWKQLSPFYLKFAEGAIFENFYQSFKVWDTVSKQKTKNWIWPEEKHVDDENPNKNWEKWHKALLYHDLPVRRPNGKNIPLYSWWQGKKLNVVDARKEIYIPYLKKLYSANPVYKKLLEKVKSGKNVMLIEPDGPFLEAYPDGLEVDLPLLHLLIDRTNYAEEGYGEKYRPYGHGYVLATCLLEDC